MHGGMVGGMGETKTFFTLLGVLRVLRLLLGVLQFYIIRSLGALGVFGLNKFRYKTMNHDKYVISLVLFQPFKY